MRRERNSAQAKVHVPWTTHVPWGTSRGLHMSRGLQYPVDYSSPRDLMGAVHGTLIPWTSNTRGHHLGLLMHPASEEEFVPEEK